MKKTSIYVDTSVIGGCKDVEFEKWSNSLLNDFKTGIYSLYLSEVTDAEIADAPEEVIEIYKEFQDCAEAKLQLDEAAIELADLYLQRKIVTENYRDDALHIALATIAGVDLVASWNFKHIVHFDKIQRFNAVNMESGYKQLAIYSPREVTKYDD